jgi:hypothetical protein
MKLICAKPSESVNDWWVVGVSVMIEIVICPLLEVDMLLQRSSFFVLLDINALSLKKYIEISFREPNQSNSQQRCLCLVLNVCQLTEQFGRRFDLSKNTKFVTLQSSSTQL